MNIDEKTINQYQDIAKSILERENQTKIAISNFIDNYQNYDHVQKQMQAMLAVAPKLPDLYDAINASTSAYETLNLSASTYNKIEKLREEIQEKETYNKSLISEIKQLKSEKQDISTKLEEINKNQAYIQKKVNLVRLTSNIHPKAADLILEEDNSELLKLFYSENETPNAIMSIDIRRSTDLMLNAKSSDDFALFITELCEGLKKIVIANFGVFDKFTGDGILAYFPSFYSGVDAVYRCCITSKLCHEYFSTHYKNNRNKFRICLKTGLGIGIDYGYAKLVRVNEQPTIVGAPVVYACRFSNAPSRHTYLNQSAYEMLKDNDIKLNEIDIDIKNQGTVTVYDLIELGNKELKEPDWYKMDP